MAVEEVDLYKAVGMAVMSSQLFERVFVFAAKFAIKQPDARTVEDIVHVNSATAFRQPIKALLNEISGTAATQGLEDRISVLIEKRHRVVHRLVDETPWPGDVTPEQRQHVYQLCMDVISESKLLTSELADLLCKWMENIPELREALESFDQRPL
ncbi:hypothetical protein KW846_03480 [Pseudomonas sp. PDM32]|uniref:hypothetical protein n=1 Tax=Pseudomonas sp. PDM32 TaxID=2854768 RepID=UPI001C448CF1|nr:hypothetical protein [Pseudomonas sp. PDM32]MBV7571754.1 hypothetical protein [Pseudomonas sp. PDM32]